MGKIEVLDEALVNKIAAGEVIERPASVVKELVENSIDAGASLIEVEVEKGGKNLIRITDDGSGMSDEDARLCVLRHATSKLKSAEDLFDIHTLGFRGEAISSIVAVSKTVIKTRMKDSVEGFALSVEGGKVTGEDSCALSNGTTIEVRNLFFNTPARLKYLKTDQTEFGHILDLITRYSLIHHKIHFRLIHNNKSVLSCPSSENMQDNIVSVYGRDTAKEMIPISGELEHIKLRGYISKPSVARNTKDMQSLFINGRYVKNKKVSDALYDAYHTLLTVHKFPVAVLAIELDPTKVDVNVHPQKQIVRIDKEDLVYKCVFDAVRNALKQSDLIPEVRASEINHAFPVSSHTKSNSNPAPTTGFTRHSAPKPKNIYGVERASQSMLADGGSASAYMPELSVQTIDSSSNLPQFRILGQFNKTYIIVDSEEGLMIVDQHAAEERVNYEKFMQGAQSGSLKTQSLLKPLQLDLSIKEKAVLLENLDVFVNMGFEIEEFGNDSLVLRRVPIDLGTYVQGGDNELYVSTIREMIDGLVDVGKADALDKKREAVLIRMSCRASVKAGEELTFTRMRKIVEDLYGTTDFFTCPHGRPIVIKFPVGELEKKFKRVQ